MGGRGDPPPRPRVFPRGTLLPPPPPGQPVHPPDTPRMSTHCARRSGDRGDPGEPSPQTGLQKWTGFWGTVTIHKWTWEQVTSRMTAVTRCGPNSGQLLSAFPVTNPLHAYDAPQGSAARGRGWGASSVVFVLGTQ